MDRDVLRRGASEDLRGAWWDCTPEMGWWEVDRKAVYRKEEHEGWGRIEMWSKGEEEECEI